MLMRRPRTAVSAVSEIYRGTTADMIPMPKPPTNRPEYRVPRLLAEVCKTEPMMKKREPMCMVRLRPTMSAGYDTTAAPTAHAIRNTKVICK